MAGMDHSRMQPSTRDSSAVVHSKMDHARMAGESAKAGAVDHAKMNMADMRDSADAPHSQLMMDLYMRMVADPVIRARVMADTAMRRMMIDMTDEMPVEHREHLQEMMRDPSAVKGRTTAPPVRHQSVHPSRNRRQRRNRHRSQRTQCLAWTTARCRV